MEGDVVFFVSLVFNLLLLNFTLLTNHIQL